MAKWEAEFNQLMNGQRDELEFDYSKDMQNAWEGGLGDFDGSLAPKRIEFDEYGIPKLEPYEFGELHVAQLSSWGLLSHHRTEQPILGRLEPGALRTRGGEGSA